MSEKTKSGIIPTPVLTTVDDLLRSRLDLISRIHKEDNSGKKLDYIADMINDVILSLDGMRTDGRKQDFELKQDIGEIQSTMLVKFKAVNAQLEDVAKRQDVETYVDTMRKDMNTNVDTIRKDMNTKFTEINDQLTLLLERKL